MNEVDVPPKPTDDERWVVKNWIHSVSVRMEQTGNDTAENFIIMTADESKSVKWNEGRFKRVASLSFEWNRCVLPKSGLIEKVRKWDEYAKKNDAELAEYERLKAKYEGANK